MASESSKIPMDIALYCSFWLIQASSQQCSVFVSSPTVTFWIFWCSDFRQELSSSGPLFFVDPVFPPCSELVIMKLPSSCSEAGAGDSSRTSSSTLFSGVSKGCCLLKDSNKACETLSGCWGVYSGFTSSSISEISFFGLLNFYLEIELLIELKLVGCGTLFFELNTGRIFPKSRIVVVALILAKGLSLLILNFLLN